MKKTIYNIHLGLMAIILILSGCTAKVSPVATPVLLPSAFSQTGSKPLAGKWWLDFNDPVLDTLIEQALSDNFSLQSSWDRLNQVEALYRKNRSTLFPSLDGEANGGHTSSDTNSGAVKTDILLLGLSAQYEVDLWGKINSTVDASRLDMESSTADLDAAAMSISSQIATTWYQLVEQNSSIQLFNDQVVTNKKGLELVTAQFRTGKVPIDDVLQQRQLIEAKISQRIQLVAQREQSKHQLTILLGLAPTSKSYDIPKQLTLLPALPETGIPAELIMARPDVRSAFHDVEAADQRVAAAIADQFPALRLSASLDTSGASGNNIFNNYLAGVAASLVGPLFDGGQRKAEVERTRAVASEKLHNYGQTILTAAGEVEDALIQEKQQILYIDSLGSQLDLASQTITLVKDRYLKGVENYQRVLTALISLQNLEREKLTAQKNLLLNRVQLCRALGTGWNYSERKKSI